MSKHLERDLEGLKREILAMGSMVWEAINCAMRALAERRPELAELVAAGDDPIDKREIAIEEECLKVLALHQPVATDLRYIITVLKVNNDLERMGDLACNMAERVAFLAKQPPIEVPLDFERMVEHVHTMVRQSLDALVEQGETIDQAFIIGCTFMMMLVCETTKRHEIPTLTALNPIMLDGTGMCGACRVTVGGTTKFTCVDGPFLDGHKIDWIELLHRRSAFGKEEKEALPQDHRSHVCHSI